MLRSIPRPGWLLLWLALGAASAAAVSFGDPLVLLLATVLCGVAVALSAGKRVRFALPVFLVSVGLLGTVLSLSSPGGAFSIDTSGHSAVCNSAGSCLGQTVVQSTFSVPVLAVYVVALLLGAIWIALPTARSRLVHHRRG
jgi:hypothetical protein